VEDQQIGRAREAFARHECHELGFDLQRVVTLGEAQPVRDPQHVGVDGDALVHSVGMSDHDVRGLAPDPRQRHELSDRARHDAAVTLQEPPGEADEAPRLGAEEAGRSDDLLDVGGRRRGECGRIRVAREELWGDLVHALVRTLGRQDRRDCEPKAFR
jgi:hypothetical protein